LSVYRLLFCSDSVYFSSLDVSSDFSLFEALRETIYSEVATLISQNESRPHFLIELFHELQLLNTDYLRQRALYSLQVQSSKKPWKFQSFVSLFSFNLDRFCICFWNWL